MDPKVPVISPQDILCNKYNKLQGSHPWTKEMNLNDALEMATTTCKDMKRLHSNDTNHVADMTPSLPFSRDIMIVESRLPTDKSDSRKSPPFPFSTI